MLSRAERDHVSLLVPGRHNCNRRECNLWISFSIHLEKSGAENTGLWMNC